MISGHIEYGQTSSAPLHPSIRVAPQPLIRIEVVNMTHTRKRIYVLIAISVLICSFIGFDAEGITRQDSSKQAAAQQAGNQQHDDFEETISRGRALVAHQDYDDAVTEFKRAAAIKNGNCVDCYRGIADADFRLKKYKDGAAALRQALSLKPENPADLYNLLGVALYFGGDKSDLNEAVAAFRQALQLSNNTLELAYFNLGFALIKQGKSAEGVEALKGYLKLAPNGANASQARAVIANPRMAGEAIAPDFKVRSIDGDDLSLAKFKGKIILLDFWATWCGPCRQEMPNVKRMWAKYSSDQFVIIGVSLDRNRDSLDRYLKSEGITWPQYYERDGRMRISDMYGVRAIPESVLIDQDGAIKAVGLRGSALYDKIGDLLKKLRKSENKS